MNTRLLIAAVLSLSAFAPNTRAGSPAQTVHPVETLFLAGIKAFNAHELDEFLRQFADDISMYTPTGWVRGAAAVRERFAETFQQFPKVRMEVEQLRVREIAPGTVITDFAWRVYPMGTGPAFHGIGSGVYVLRGGRWVEVLEHETVVKVDDGLGPPRK